MSTSGPDLYVLDALNGNLKRTLRDHNNYQNCPIEACFTSDSKYIMCGGPNGRVNVWDTESFTPTCSLEGSASSPLYLKFNPRYAMFASANDNVVR